MRLSDTQKVALDLLFDKGAIARSGKWLGSREGVAGTTLEALSARGLAATRWADKPYRRIVGQLTGEGEVLVADRRRKLAPPKISVEFTREEWSALRACARGELEGLTEHDYASGIADELVAATKAMDAARDAWAVENDRRAQ